MLYFYSKENRFKLSPQCWCKFQLIVSQVGWGHLLSLVTHNLCKVKRQIAFFTYYKSKSSFFKISYLAANGIAHFRFSLILFNQFQDGSILNAGVDHQYIKCRSKVDQILNWIHLIYIWYAFGMLLLCFWLKETKTRKIEKTWPWDEDWMLCQNRIHKRKESRIY